MVAGVIEKYTKNDEIECIPTKQARVIELIVNEKHRGKNIGKLLMDKAEKYFQSQKCDVIFVDVFEPNVKAHDFYKKSGYQNRLITMIKKLP
ncbi:MAG: GNAT family N-acetyltransferase [Candidatus Peregrinibacteria bacterium]|nr:GNAT family N-acetyltransferase [Candidatus Peregrinibacteria bacterium]MDZ4244608.1 GNAT family N-acetyltransferase [Candidatus Gracilibacteria bacterium]